jgi:menaquinone-specific isochorismate synthase
MRHPPLPFAFLRITPERVAWAEAGPEGWQKTSTPPQDGPFFWAPDFFLNDPEPFFKPHFFAELSVKEARARLQRWCDPNDGTEENEKLFEGLTWERASKTNAKTAFEDLMAHIENGALEKAVPITIDRAHAPTPGALHHTLTLRLSEIFEALMKLPDTLMPLMFFEGAEWMFGATPETLLHQSGGLIRTQAVAGTTFDPQKSLLQDPKELHEHDVVLKEIKKNLSPYGEVRLGETYEKKLPRLKHLVTEITLTPFEPTSLIATALKLHPTPALGGSPQKEAFTWLRHQPSSRLRRRYGAPFGFVTAQGDGHLVVAIRTLQVVNDTLLSIAGAGVVRESQFENEWNEMAAKKKSVFEIFGER